MSCKTKAIVLVSGCWAHNRPTTLLLFSHLINYFKDQSNTQENKSSTPMFNTSALAQIVFYNSKK